ncbi:hypothetical protein H1R20_g7515, partial [Candolleomyces eurysporus]
MMPPRKLYFIGLNVVRALSIVSLILVFASSIVVMVTNIKAVNAFEANKGSNSTNGHGMVDCDYIEGSTVPNQPAGVFWAVVATLLILFQTIILFFSEVSWPMSFFDRYFPVLGSQFGLGALGIFQGLIATQILSHHADDFTLVSAFFLFSLGCVNMLLGLIFRAGAKEKRSIRGWRAEAKGVLPTSKDMRPQFGAPAPGYVSSAFTGGSSEKAGYLHQSYDRSDAESWRSTEKASLGFGRQGEKAAGLRGFMLQRPEESLPRYVSPPASTGHHGADHLSRSNTTVSSESSWSSPSSRPSHYRHESRQAQLRDAILEQMPPRREEQSDSRPQTPVFKSSQTAL